MARKPKSLSLKPKAPKIQKPRRVLFADIKYMGDEPEWNLDQATQIQLIKAFGWYNYYYQEGDNKKRFLAYMKSSGKDPKNYTIIEESDVPQVVGSMCAMVSRGCVLPDDMMSRLNKHIDNIGLTALSRESQKIEEKAAPVKPRVSRDTTIAELEELKDKALLGTLEADWCSYTWATSRKTSSLVANKVIAYYSPILAELKAATKRGADPELKEGYRSLSMMEVRRIDAFMSNLISDMEKIKGTKAITRKPRKPRTKKVENVVKKFRFQKEDLTLKVASVQVEKLLGAKSAWFFDTEKRLLIKAESDGFTITGTTLGSITKAGIKRIRKPEDVIPDFVKLTRLQKNKAFIAIKAVENPNWSGRTTENVLILAVESC